jgi:hypothetical protein
MNDYGIAHYLILPNGNLQGLWVHSGTTRDFAEVARKNGEFEGLIGSYDTAYSDRAGSYVGVLTIGGDGKVFTFDWKTADGLCFTGTGLMVSADVIAVAYRDVPSSTSN